MGEKNIGRRVQITLGRSRKEGVKRWDFTWVSSKLLATILLLLSLGCWGRSQAAPLLLCHLSLKCIDQQFPPRLAAATPAPCSPAQCKATAQQVTWQRLGPVLASQPQRVPAAPWLPMPQPACAGCGACSLSHAQLLSQVPCTALPLLLPPEIALQLAWALPQGTCWAVAGLHSTARAGFGLRPSLSWGRRCAQDGTGHPPAAWQSHVSEKSPFETVKDWSWDIIPTQLCLQTIKIHRRTVLPRLRNHKSPPRDLKLTQSSLAMLWMHAQRGLTICSNQIC